LLIPLSIGSLKLIDFVFFLLSLFVLADAFCRLIFEESLIKKIKG